MDKKIVEGRWILEAVDPVIFGACDTVLNLLEKLSYSEDNSDIYINDIKFIIDSENNQSRLMYFPFLLLQ